MTVWIGYPCVLVNVMKVASHNMRRLRSPTAVAASSRGNGYGGYRRPLIHTCWWAEALTRRRLRPRWAPAGCRRLHRRRPLHSPRRGSIIIPSWARRPSHPCLQPLRRPAPCPGAVLASRAGPCRSWFLGRSCPSFLYLCPSYRRVCKGLCPAVKMKTRECEVRIR